MTSYALYIQSSEKKEYDFSVTIRHEIIKGLSDTD